MKESLLTSPRCLEDSHLLCCTIGWSCSPTGQALLHVASPEMTEIGVPEALLSLFINMHGPRCIHQEIWAQHLQLMDIYTS